MKPIAVQSSWRPKLGALLPLLMMAFQMTAQSGTIDSLRAVASSAENDSVRVSALYQWAQLIYYTNPELDLDLNRQIQAISAAHASDSTDAQQLFFLDALASATENIG